jgi:ribose-phosphate pyrophosphokinase
MKKVLFAFHEQQELGAILAAGIEAEIGKYTIRNFPDEESYVRIECDVNGKEVIILCSLHRPDSRILSVYFLAKLAKDLGASKVVLIAPYLSYMRQDKRFKPGEAVTSSYFAALVSSFADVLITIDPHLHRLSSLAQIYSIPCHTMHAASLITAYIKEHVPAAVLIGPDEESRQWVSEVANDAGIPFVILEKTRKGDTDVSVSQPQLDEFHDHIPVLVDDIISTAHTMIATIRHLTAQGMKAPICIGVHAIFSGNALNELQAAGAGEIITCNTITHLTNKIDISPLLITAIQRDDQQ